MGRHLLREVRREHAGLVEPWRFVMFHRVAIGSALKPFRMRCIRFIVGVIAIETRDDADTACLVALVKSPKRSWCPGTRSVVVRNCGGIEGHDAAGIQQQSVKLERDQ